MEKKIPNTVKQSIKDSSDEILFALIGSKKSSKIEKERACDIIFDRYKNYVWSIAFKMFNKMEKADEMSLLIFEKTFQKSTLFNRKKCFKTKAWIGKIAVNVIKDVIRKEKRENQKFEDANFEIINVPDINIFSNRPNRNVQKRIISENESQLILILNELPDYQREVLFVYLRYDVLPNGKFTKNLVLPDHEIEYLLKTFPNNLTNRNYIPKVRTRAFDSICKKLKN